MTPEAEIIFNSVLLIKKLRFREFFFHSQGRDGTGEQTPLVPDLPFSVTSLSLDKAGVGLCHSK